MTTGGAVRQKEGGGLKKGDIIGEKYQLLRALGRGGEGSVYLARHLATGVLWAVKAVPESQRAQCLRELEMARRFRHPGILQIADYLEEEGYCFLVMEYIRGGSLKDRDGLTLEEFLRLSCQIAGILVCLHTGPRPVLHLDLKPANILLREDGTPVLIDFGIALEKNAAFGNRSFGTRGFAAPEQFDARQAPDERTDLFGFGAAMYSAFYGKAYEPGQPPEVRAETGREKRWEKKARKILISCLEEDREKRMQSSRELYLALRRLGRRRERAAKRRGILGAAGLFLSVLFFLVGLTAAFEGDAKEGRREELLSQAEHLGYEQAVSCYQEAVRLAPQEGEAYQGLLSRMLEDGSFALEEEERLKETLYGFLDDQGKTPLERLKENPEAYGAFAYRAGIAYWYYYAGSGGKAAAGSWFEEAASLSGSLEKRPVWERDARIHAKISRYYDRLLQKEEGEQYLPLYWQDLTGLFQTEGGQMEETVRRQVEEELLNFMILHFSVFQEEPEREAEAEEILKRIRKGGEEEKEQENREALQEKVSQAEAAVRRVYQKWGMET